MRFVWWIERIAYDLRHAARGLRADWSFALFAIATIAVGIGLAASVLSIADGILFRPLPYAHADRLVVPFEAGVGSVSPESIETFQSRTGLVFVLLAAAGLTIQSFDNLQNVDVGINPDGIDLLSLNLPRSKYSGPEREAFSQDLIARFLRIPGVDSAAGLYVPPVSSAAGWTAVDIPNAPARTAQTWPVTHCHFDTFALGVVQYVVSRRTREIGIRMALGARAPQVRGMVLRQALAPVAAGLFGGFVAYLPARHAVRINPIDAIRAE